MREGRSFDLGRTLDTRAPRFPGRYWQQTLVSSAHFSNRRRSGGTPEGWGENRLNWITELVTGKLQIGTRPDGLNHLQNDDRFYNGRRAEMENLDLAALAAAGVAEFLFVLTHGKTHGSTAATIAPAAVI